MARTRISTAARRRGSSRLRMAMRPQAWFGEVETGWIDLGGSELRLHGDGGVIWSFVLPDPQTALGRLEFGATDLAAFDGGTPDDEGDAWHEHAGRAGPGRAGDRHDR
jgi:hypothetical protein